MRSGVLVACFYMHARRVVSRFDAKGHQELSGYDLYESLNVLGSSSHHSL